MTGSQWLADLLSVHGLAQPDGRMLYAYRLTDSQFKQLHVELSAFSGLSLDEFWWSRDFPKLFVMYSAEWWRRKYQGGAWRWTPILESFGCDAQDFLPNNRSDAVIRGLAYWGHRPNGEGKIYFGAVVAHGGLPLAFIGNGGGKLASIMGCTLRLTARYGWEEASIIQSVEDQAEGLPDSLQRPEIYQLIASMVLAVLELRQEFGLAGMADPVAHLADRDPKWQERFPLPLEDVAAQKLLAGLVKEASQTTIQHLGVFSVERTLRHLDGGCYQLVSSLICPASASAESLVALFGLPKDRDLPRYFSIDVQVQEREPFADARQILGANLATVSLAGRKRVWQAKSACAEHCLFIRAAQGDLRGSPLSIPGGQELTFTEPWIFVTRDEKTTLVAIGGARVPDGDALIVLPPSWTVSISDSNSIAGKVGTLELGDISLDILLVKGDVSLHSGENRYRVRTQQSTGNEDTYAWEGSRFAYLSRPNAIYRGVPKLYRHSSTGERSRVPTTQLEWFVAGTKNRISDSNMARGPVDVFVVRDGERYARFRFVVLDSSASIDFESGKSSNKGVLHFANWGFTDISVAGQGILTFDVARGQDRTSLMISTGDIPPESLTASLRWKPTMVEADITLPFPSSGGRFFDSTGKSLKDNDILTLRNLVGSRLRIFDHNPQSPKRYDLELVLSRPVRSRRDCDLRVEQQIPLQANGSAELRLIDLQRQIESLMGFSNELDAAVEVAILVGRQRASVIRVSRYEVSIEIGPSTIQFAAAHTERLDISALQATIVCAVPLSDITAEPLHLIQSETEGVPTATWPTAMLPNATVPWLVFPDKRSKISFRPTVLASIAATTALDNAADPRCPLTKAIAGSRSSRERLEHISGVFDDMVMNFTHPSWRLIDQIWETFNHLPLSTLDVFRGLGSHPSAAVAFLLRSDLADDARAELSRRLRDECGLVWELAPIDIWRTALKSLWQYWSGILGDAAESTFRIILANRLGRLAIEHPVLKVTIEFLQLEWTGSPSTELLEIMRIAGRDPLYYSNKLLRGEESLVQLLLFHGHSQDANWPDKQFLTLALSAFDEAAPPIMTKKSVSDASKKMFWIVPNDHKMSVVNLPVLCAIWIASGTNSDWWADPEHRLTLRRIKAFDPIWFEHAFRYTFATCLATGIVTQQENGFRESAATAERTELV